MKNTLILFVILLSSVLLTGCLPKADNLSVDSSTQQKVVEITPIKSKTLEEKTEEDTKVDVTPTEEVKPTTTKTNSSYNQIKIDDIDKIFAELEQLSFDEEVEF